MKTNAAYGLALRTIFAAVVIELGSCSVARPQSQLVASNLSESTVRTKEIAQDSWVAVTFTTGTNPNGYSLDSIQLSMGESTGSPDGFNLSLYAVVPGGTIGSPDFDRNLGDLSGSDPLSEGVFSYSAFGLTLAPSTSYFVVATSSTSAEIGAFQWNVPSSGAYDSIEDWTMVGARLESDNGADWSTVRGLLQYGVSATAIPEPSTLVLLGCGALFAAIRLRRAMRVRAE